MKGPGGYVLLNSTRDLFAIPGVTFSKGTVDVGPGLMTGHPGVFAGGDMVPAERTVTVAIGHGSIAMVPEET